MSHQSVDVDLVVDATAAVAPPPPPRSRGRVGVAVLAVAAVVVALLVWPDGSTPEAGPAEGEVAQPPPVPDDARLLPWPARGPYAADEEFVQLAADAWRTQASVSSPPDVPAGEVYPLWAGTVGTTAVALLQAVGADGLPRVAQLSESRRPPDVQRGPLVLTTVETVTTSPEMLGVVYAGGLDLGYVLDQPGRDVLQVLPAPGLLTEGVELQRQEGARFVPLVLQPDGLTQPWVHGVQQASEGSVVAAVRVRGADPGILVDGLVVPGQVVPGPTPVQLVPPEWGTTTRSSPDNYVDALAALESLGRSAGRVAVLGTAPLSGSRATLLEVRPEGPGSPVVVAVHAVGVRQTVSGPQPARLPTEIALGAVRLAGGVLVVVGAGPPDTDLLVYGADGRPVGTGPRVSAIVLPTDEAVSELAVQGYRTDETFVGRSVLTLGEG